MLFGGGCMFCQNLRNMPVGTWCNVVVASVSPKSVLYGHGIRAGHVFTNCYIPRPFSSDGSKRIVVWFHGGAISLYAGSDECVETLHLQSQLYCENLVYQRRENSCYSSLHGV